MSSEWTTKKNWIAASSDRLHPGRHIELGIERWIFRDRSPYQEVAIAAVPGYGLGLFLDAVLEFIEADEFIYHENLVLPALLHHPAPKRVLIQGGGDGLALREVLRDPRVEQVVMVELDEMVIDACKSHLSGLHRGSFDDSRAEVLVQDVFPYLQTTEKKFDIVYVDLLDGYDAAARSLYAKVLTETKRVLAPGAILAAFGDLLSLVNSAGVVYQGLVQHFERVVSHRATIESFSGEYAFFLASSESQRFSVDAETMAARADALSGTLEALVPSHFPSAFSLPRYARRVLEASSSVDRPDESMESMTLADSFGWVEPKV